MVRKYPEKTAPETWDVFAGIDSNDPYYTKEGDVVFVEGELIYQRDEKGDKPIKKSTFLGKVGLAKKNKLL